MQFFNDLSIKGIVQFGTINPDCRDLILLFEL